MITKGKRKHLTSLYRHPKMEFFTRDDKLCLRVGNEIITNLVPMGHINPADEVKTFPIDFKPAETSTVYRPEKATVYERGAGALDGIINPLMHDPKLIDRSPSAFISPLTNVVIPPKGI
jgi:hypothetical protein